jgi:hypothetical protein
MEMTKITKVKEGSIKQVICYKLDRLGRSLSDLLSTIDIFNKFPKTQNNSVVTRNKTKPFDG